ncbi:MAG TPA: hypothetical protein VK629_03935 [Steroidobacteraceae bacterium]|nr:hypothetical protein [Steroidobacteraceae bacterium]
MQKKDKPSLLDRLLGRLSPTPAKIRGSAPARTPRPFQAISIQPGVACCDVARQISGDRFLAKNAPQLPLYDCTMRDTCQCRYAKHVDRRGDSRRFTEFGLRQSLSSTKERRISRRGRRAKDL